MLRRGPVSHRWLWWLLLGFLGLLLIGRLAGPSIAAAVVRKSLHELKGGYHGDLKDVDLSVLTGQVHIQGMYVVKSNGKVPVPFLQVERFTLAVVRDGWKPRAEIRLYRPKITYVDAKQKAEQQWGPEFKLEELRQKLPLELAALRIEDGQVHFRNFEAKPEVDARATKLDVTWENLVGCLPPGWPTCRSELRVKAAVLDKGRLTARGRFDRKPENAFTLSADLANLQPARLNPALLEYVKIDAQGGHIDADVRLGQHGESMRLVVVPRLYDVDIAGGGSEDTKWVREAAAGVAAGWFERKRGSKAIAYTKHGKGKGSVSLIDWKEGRSAERENSGPSVANAD